MNCECDFCKWTKIISAGVIILFLIVIVIIMATNPSQPKNILTAIAEPGDNTDIGIATINFSKNEITEGTAITHDPGSNTININETGFYRISYQLFGRLERTGIFNFNAIILVNDAGVTSTQNESPVLTDNVNNRMTLTSSFILKLNAGDTLKLQGFSLEEIIYDNVRIDINKL